jgi:uncharacterized phage protein (TIGR01671 family)
MRQLKFRVWDNLKKEWVSNKSIWRMKTDPNGIGEIEPNAFYWKQHSQGLTIQQFTGLLDSEEREIYEGDIVIYRNKNREIRIGQFWNGEDDRVGCFIQDPMVTHRNFGTNRVSAFEKCEIIGNIFENPELLK